MTWTRHENGAGATPTFGRRRRRRRTALHYTLCLYPNGDPRKK